MSGLYARSRAPTLRLEAISPSFGYGEFTRLLRRKGLKMYGIVGAFARLHVALAWFHASKADMQHPKCYGALCAFEERAAL